MKVTHASVAVCRNFVTLKITADEGLTGLGDATAIWPENILINVRTCR